MRGAFPRPTPPPPYRLYTYNTRARFELFYAIASYKCRPDGYQSQITFNKTTWKRWNNPFWTFFTEQNPITFSLSHVTGAFPRPTPPPPIGSIYIQYACKIWKFLYDIASYKCRPDGYQSQINFNKTTWNDETIPSEQFPLNKTPSHFLWVTWEAHFPDLPHPHLTGSIHVHTIRVQDSNDFYAIASYKCRLDGYQSQITFNKTTWKQWNNPFWTFFTEQNPITFSLSHVTGAFPRPNPPPPIGSRYTIRVQDLKVFLWYSFI